MSLTQLPQINMLNSDDTVYQIFQFNKELDCWIYFATAMDKEDAQTYIDSPLYRVTSLTNAKTYLVHHKPVGKNIKNKLMRKQPQIEVRYKHWSLFPSMMSLRNQATTTYCPQRMMPPPSDTPEDPTQNQKLAAQARWNKVNTQEEV